MTLAPFQMSYNGIVIGDGTVYPVTQIVGLDALPDIADTNVNRMRDQGQYIGAFYATRREIVVNLEVIDTSDAAFRADIEALTAATAPQISTELPLAFVLPGMAQVSRQSMCRVQKRTLDVDFPYVQHYATMELDFWASDPRIYDSTVQSVTLNLPTGTGGTSWPAAWPLSWGTASAGGTAAVLNSGNFEMRPTVTFTGPVDNPSISNDTAGMHLTFALSLLSTDTLTVNLYNKTVLLNGSGNRRGTLTSDSQWWSLAPGSSTVRYSANTVQVGSTATVTWQSAWL